MCTGGTSVPPYRSHSGRIDPAAIWRTCRLSSEPWLFTPRVQPHESRQRRRSVRPIARVRIVRTVTRARPRPLTPRIRASTVPCTPHAERLTALERAVSHADCSWRLSSRACARRCVQLDSHRQPTPTAPQPFMPTAVGSSASRPHARCCKMHSPAAASPPPLRSATQRAHSREAVRRMPSRCCSRRSAAHLLRGRPRLASQMWSTMRLMRSFEQRPRSSAHGRRCGSVRVRPSTGSTWPAAHRVHGHVHVRVRWTAGSDAATSGFTRRESDSSAAQTRSPRSAAAPAARWARRGGRFARRRNRWAERATLAFSHPRSTAPRRREPRSRTVRTAFGPMRSGPHATTRAPRSGVRRGILSGRCSTVFATRSDSIARLP